jgi:hypothetical protein
MAKISGLRDGQASPAVSNAIWPIHLYPFVDVIERNHRPIARFISYRVVW